LLSESLESGRRQRRLYGISGEKNGRSELSNERVRVSYVRSRVQVLSNNILEHRLSSFLGQVFAQFEVYNMYIGAQHLAHARIERHDQHPFELKKGARRAVVRLQQAVCKKHAQRHSETTTFVGARTCSRLRCMTRILFTAGHGMMLSKAEMSPPVIWCAIVVAAGALTFLVAVTVVKFAAFL